MVRKKSKKNKWCYQRPKGMMSYEWDLDWRLYQKQKDIIMYITMEKWNAIMSLNKSTLLSAKNTAFYDKTRDRTAEINSINAHLETLVKEFRQKNNADEIFKREKVLLVPVKDFSPRGSSADVL